jgi:putative ABC transport system ATP-binding protein
MISNDVLAVRCRGVTKSYGVGNARVQALRGVDLEVRPGELVMIVGPSGCGKTTLISVIAGILNQDEGQCLVYSQDLKGIGQQERTRFRGKNVGFVFQALNLVPTLTALENVMVPLLINGIPPRNALPRAQEALARVELADRKDSFPEQLSGGQQQRVAIARALVNEPRLIVCDEPTSALDHETGRRVMKLMREVVLSENRCLLVVTHDARIFEFADRIARMDDGRIVEVTGNGKDPAPVKEATP